MKVKYLAKFPSHIFCEDGDILHRSKKNPYLTRRLPQTLVKNIQRKGKPYYRKIVNIADKDGNRHVAKVHQLICEAFYGPRPSKKHEVRHLDGNSLNNRAENLRWGTRIENQQDRVRHGSSNRGERCGNVKLNRKKVLAIRNSKMTGRELAKKYNMSVSAISSIKNKRNWSWL